MRKIIILSKAIMVTMVQAMMELVIAVRLALTTITVFTVNINIIINAIGSFAVWLWFMLCLTCPAQFA